MRASEPVEHGDAAWLRRQERGNRWLLTAMRWLALGAGRRLARLVLHPIALYFVLVNGEARRQSRRYLGRALGRRAGWLDGYRHIHSFAATVLDRVYLLQSRFDQFRLETPGVDIMDEVLSEGRGVFLVGAHIGSFEALRAIGHDRGERVAMVMYEDNARLINQTFAAIAPDAAPHIIALGHLDAMLNLRRWLDDGGIAGLLADRTLPQASGRSRTVELPFLGRPARFSDGPFRLAAMLRRPVVFMAGLYHGGPNYELRFLKIADFSERALPRGADLELHIQEALQRYVEQLESLCLRAPYNWFNFFDFWGEDTAPTPRPGAPVAKP